MFNWLKEREGGTCTTAKWTDKNELTVNLGDDAMPGDNIIIHLTFKACDVYPETIEVEYE